jgi:hypothetical protein
MSEVVRLQRPINWTRPRADEAERVIRERAKTTANVVFSEHAFVRIKQRSIVQEDVYWILETGTVEGSPAREEGAWKAIVVRRMPGEREAGVVTLFVRENEDLFVKTVEWMDWRR